MKERKQKKHNLSVGILFILLIVFLFAFSFTLKAFEVYGNSLFDGRNNFYISHLGSGGYEVIVLSPNDNSIKILGIKTKTSSEFKELRIPEDLRINSDNDIDPDSVKDVLRSLIPTSGVNIFDILKINLFLSSVDRENIEEDELRIDDERLSLKISESLSDELLLSEKLTIELVNSTGEAGVGSNIAKLITNMGGNVILVSTGTKVEPASEILTKSDNYSTVRKIARILNIPIDTSSQPPLSDVKIIIGKDLLSFYK